MNSTYLNPKYLTALLNIAPKGDLRYYLCGVLVEMTAKDTRYVACNGHILAVIRDERDRQPEQMPGTVLIPREAIEMMGKVKMPKGVGIEPKVELRYEAEPGKEARLGNVCFLPIEGKFPKYREVIPAAVSGEKGHYKPEYLMTFQRTASAAFGGGNSAYNEPLPEVWENGTQAAALVLINTHPNFVGVLMPFRQTSDGKAPAWAKEPLPITVAEAANAPAEMAAAD